ncbi:hypothetical protein JW707_02635 [Candidatus Woesearchaeota archaeon]|nr:hypothetical protein [Candidatus Woesearchaeota archaeon]
MDETKAEFEQEIKTALKYTLDIEKHLQEMDPDDVKYLCQKIRFALERTLKDLQDGKIKAKKF